MPPQRLQHFVPTDDDIVVFFNVFFEASDDADRSVDDGVGGGVGIDR